MTVDRWRVAYLLSTRKLDNLNRPSLIIFLSDHQSTSTSPIRLEGVMPCCISWCDLGSIGVEDLCTFGIRKLEGTMFQQFVLIRLSTHIWRETNVMLSKACLDHSPASSFCGVKMGEGNECHERDVKPRNQLLGPAPVSDHLSLASLVVDVCRKDCS